MSGHISVVGAKFPQAATHHAKMLGFLESHLHPAVEKRIRHALAGESGNDIKREVDGVQFDMGDGMQEGNPPAGGMQRATHDLGRCYEFRPDRASRPVGYRKVKRRTQGKRALVPAAGCFLCKPGFQVEVCGGDRLCGAVAQALDRGEAAHAVAPPARAVASCSTSSTWPAILTFSQSAATVPSGETSSVVRSTPMYLRP